MPSKRSFFNGTLFRKNMSRSWPLWGSLSAAGALVPLYLLLELMQRRPIYVAPAEFAELLYNAVTLFAPGFTAVYAALCAMVVWGYLYNTRSVGMFHALPVDRTCLFVTNSVSGLVMILIPYAVTGLLICLLAICWGFFDLIAVLNTALAVVLLAATFFGIATLCAMLTGHIVVLPALYILVNFLAPLLSVLFLSLAQKFLIGIGPDGTSFVLSPLLKIYQSFFSRYQYRYYESPDGVPALSGLWIVALYALAGLVLLALAWFLYKKRHSECAGDVVAFRWMRPVFRYGIALLCALTLGWVLYMVLWEELFQQGEYYDVLPMFVCTAITGLIGYYAASMLLAKSKRVFRGSLKGVGIVCAGAAALMLLVSVDVFGAERRVPALEDIDSVSLTDWSASPGWFYTADDPEQVEEIRAFHQAVVDDRDYIRSCSRNFRSENSRDTQVSSHYIHLTYQLKDGSTLRRIYEVWFTSDRAAQPGTYEDRFIQFQTDPVVQRRAVEIPEGGILSSMHIYTTYTDSISTSVDQSNDDLVALYAAILRDVDEGNCPTMDALSDSTERGSLCIQIGYQISLDPRDGSWTYRYKSIDVSPEMTNTLDALLEHHFVTKAALDLWIEYYAASAEASGYLETSEVW